MITDAGDNIWRDFFGKSPAETVLNRQSRDLLQDAIVFNHRPEAANHSTHAMADENDRFSVRKFFRDPVQLTAKQCR